MKSSMKTHPLLRAASASVALLALQAHAHEGHGIETASHWHATDTLGLILAGVAVVIAVWFTRGGK